MLMDGVDTFFEAASLAVKEAFDPEVPGFRMVTPPGGNPQDGKILNPGQYGRFQAAEQAGRAPLVTREMMPQFERQDVYKATARADALSPQGFSDPSHGVNMARIHVAPDPAPGGPVATDKTPFGTPYAPHMPVPTGYKATAPQADMTLEQRHYNLAESDATERQRGQALQHLENVRGFYDSRHKAWGGAPTPDEWSANTERALQMAKTEPARAPMHGPMSGFEQKAHGISQLPEVPGPGLIQRGMEKVRGAADMATQGLQSMKTKAQGWGSGVEQELKGFLDPIRQGISPENFQKMYGDTMKSMAQSVPQHLSSAWNALKERGMDPDTFRTLTVLSRRGNPRAQNILRRMYEGPGTQETLDQIFGLGTKHGSLKVSPEMLQVARSLR